MTFEIEVNGRTRAVTVERAGAGRYRIGVEGTIHEVDAVRVGNFGLSMLFDAEGGATREMLVTPAGTPGEVLVGLDGRVVAATVNGRRTRRGAGDAGGRTEGEQAILAPMPGRVVRVLVAPGDDVVAKQGVIVVEAMKMENELRSPKAGRVKDVAVAAGTSVEAGRVLVVVE
jgi:biotin carboxyl carrier protein